MWYAEREYQEIITCVVEISRISEIDDIYYRSNIDSLCFQLTHVHWSKETLGNALKCDAYFYYMYYTFTNLISVQLYILIHVL